MADVLKMSARFATLSRLGEIILVAEVKWHTRNSVAMRQKVSRRKRAAKPIVHAVFDEASLARQAVGLAGEKYEQEVFDIAARLKETSRFISMEKLNDLEHQVGERLTLKSFEARLRRICTGNLHWHQNKLAPGNCSFLGLTPDTVIKSISIKLPDGTLQWVASYVATEYLAEYTLILTSTQRMPAPRTHMSARDFPKAEQVKDSDGTLRWQFTGPTPLDAYTYESPEGKIPGWREVLYRCIAAGLVGVQAAELEFRPSERASWAMKTGKQQLSLEL